ERQRLIYRAKRPFVVARVLQPFSPAQPRPDLERLLLPRLFGARLALRVSKATRVFVSQNSAIIVPRLEQLIALIEETRRQSRDVRLGSRAREGRARGWAGLGHIERVLNGRVPDTAVIRAVSRLDALLTLSGCHEGRVPDGADEGITAGVRSASRGMD